MSADHKRNTGPRGSAQAKERVITREKRVPAKVIIGEVPDIDFRAGTGPLKGAVTVIMSDGRSSRHFVVHRPIGITDLPADAWVISPAEEVPLLLARAVDPNAQRTSQLRAEYREHLATLCKPALLVYKEGVIAYPNGVARTDTVRAARQVASREDTGGKGAPKPFYADFIPDPKTQGFEMAFLEFGKLDSTNKMIMGKYPDDYRTQGGVNADNPQVAASLAGRSPPTEQVFDGLVFQVANTTIMSLTDAKALKRGGTLPDIPKAAPPIPPRPKVAAKSSGKTTPKEPPKPAVEEGL